MRNPLEAMLSNQFAQIQENLARAMEELQSAVVEGATGGGAVKVEMTGAGEILSVQIAPAAVSDGDLELLQDLVCAAVRDASNKAQALKRQKLMAATPFGALGIEMPDVF